MSVVSTPASGGNSRSLLGVADERLDDAQPVAGRALDVVRLLAAAGG